MRPQPDRVIATRPVRPAFERAEKRLWFRDDRFGTAFFNAYLLLLCDEFEFVAIVRRYLADVSDPALKAQLKGWLGQEAAHGVQHRKACVHLDRVGLRYRGYHKVLSFVVFRVLFALMSRRLRIAVIAALEHLNTMLGEMCLRKVDYFGDSDAELSLLLRWHFAEEIEHRAVIHDVAEALRVGYVMRVLAGGLAYLLYTGILMATTVWLLLQNFDWCRPSTYWRLLRFAFVDERFVQYSLAYARDYLAPSFHPLGRDCDRYAAPVFAQIASPRH
ncbi:metal-dependent hydrolase [Paucibacter sp. APW11]|uniref:Metal-dependent hydrolase n=1 Tax=Roseateles aquae TaxID=3077235 RepID=A0ABU3P7K3_9BURK|nr:metal-dependent hydrolase [Paucibacter sp. APW11]MDT8997721.1 metal-dependent hydrolase [Paucibacter sp. APW11]